MNGSQGCSRDVKKMPGAPGSCATLPVTRTKPRETRPQLKLNIPGSTSTLPFPKTKIAHTTPKKPQTPPAGNRTPVSPPTKAQVAEKKSTAFENKLRMLESSLGMPGNKPSVANAKPAVSPKPGVKPRRVNAKEGNGKETGVRVAKEKDSDSTVKALSNKGSARGAIASRVAQFEKSMIK